MGVGSSAKKKLKQDVKRRKTNLHVKDAVKEAVKKFRAQPSKKLLTDAFSLLDIAAKKNVIHDNKASRLKSRLSKLLTKKFSSAKQPETAPKKFTSRKKKLVV